MSTLVNPARGMRDLLPCDKRVKELMISKIKSVYQSFGYEEIETPALENLDRLMSSDGGENLSMIFQILKRGLVGNDTVIVRDASDLGLRYDLTLPLARFYASNISSLPSELRTIQVAPVWRAERPQKGRFRQFMQCDIDIIGVPDERAEIELICVTLLALKAIGMESVTVRLNDRRVLISLLEQFGFPSSVHSAVLIVVDKLDKVGVDGVIKELREKKLGDENSIFYVQRFLSKIASLEKNESFDLMHMFSLMPPDTASEQLDAIKFIHKNTLKALPNAKIRFDPTLVRGMGYYTGAIFEIEVDGLNKSVAGGGRYDDMIGRFTGKKVPACGFSLGFDRLIELIPNKPDTKVKKLALFYGDDLSIGALLYEQQNLIELGYTVTLMCRPRKFGKALDAISKDGFQFYIDAHADSTGCINIKEIKEVRPSGHTSTS